MKQGNVEKKLRKEIEEERCIHIPLFDPDTLSTEVARKIAAQCYNLGSTAIMVGGSLGVTERELDVYIKAIKRSCPLPVILFPGSLTGLSRCADAVWFMSVLNSENTHYISGAQALGAPIVRKMGIEAIPLGYLILGEGGTAGYVGQARLIPYNRPEIVAAYSLAAQYMGMRFVYLEAGSGVKTAVPPKIVALLKRVTEVTIIVGGGINSGQIAYDLANAGANIIVTGTLLEKGDDSLSELKNIIRSIEEAAHVSRTERSRKRDQT